MEKICRNICFVFVFRISLHFEKMPYIFFLYFGGINAQKQCTLCARYAQLPDQILHANRKAREEKMMWVCVTQVEPMKCYFNWIFSTIKSKPEYEKTLCSYDLMSPDVFFHLKLCAQQKSLHLLISLSTLELIQWNVDYLNDFCKWLQLGITERGSKCV